ncbi:hypothetical protein [Brachybacterium vulturis]|nr:hypothetical protein [Brachybacterium vulturis]
MTTLTDRMTTTLEQYSTWQEPLLTDLQPSSRAVDARGAHPRDHR